MLHQSIYTLMLYLVIVNCSKNPYCSLSCQEKNEVFKHTVCEREDEKCGPHSHCGPDVKSIKMEESLRHFILNVHNKLRNNVASGNETRGYQPAASNMEILRYNLELEFIAKCWANACNAVPLEHDKCRRTKSYYVGQNLANFISLSPNFSLKLIIETLITSWYEEVVIFKKEWIKDAQNRGTNDVAHYTQLVWADTKEIGCGLTYYTTRNDSTHQKSHGYLLVCNYGPSGNHISTPVYLEGRPCTACKTKHCNKQYTSLCEGGTSTINKTFDAIFKI